MNVCKMDELLELWVLAFITGGRETGQGQGKMMYSFLDTVVTSCVAVWWVVLGLEFRRDIEGEEN